MNLTYTGRLDFRSVSSRDFPQFTFDFDEDVEAKEWVWVPGVTLEVPDEVGEFLCQHHRVEFKQLVEDEPDLDIPEAKMVTSDDEPEPTRDERGLELSELSKEELIEIYDQKDLDWPRPKATKPQLVEGLLNYYYPMPDESLDHDSVDPDSEPDQP